MSELPSWNDTPTRELIAAYVEGATGDRVAVFDNDGTLWCEKPVPIELDFILRRWAAMAEEDASLRTRQPFKAAHERVIGSSFGLQYDDDAGLVYKGGIEFFDDGPEKPVRIWSRVGRRPALACGNANGDMPMLRFADGLRLLVLHDDPEREFDYTGGAEHALAQGFTTISVKNDWATVFSGRP